MKPSPPILLVEDNSADAELIKLALPRAGFHDRVVWVSTGEAAVEYLEGKGRFSDRALNPRPQVILLDLTLAKLSGFKVLKQQAQCKDMAGVPTIVLTSSQNPADVDRAFELGAKGYIIKPTSFEELVTMLSIKVNFCLHGGNSKPTAPAVMKRRSSRKRVS